MANGRQPLGYKRGEDGRVVLDDANAAVVREIFTRVAAGDLFVDIARDLNAQGIKTSKEPTGTRAASRAFARMNGTEASTYTGMSGWLMAFHA